MRTVLPPQAAQFVPPLRASDVLTLLLSAAVVGWFLLGLWNRLIGHRLGRKPTHDLITTLSDWCIWLRRSAVEAFRSRPALLEAMQSGLAVLSLVFLMPAAVGATYANLRLLGPIVGFVFSVPNNLAMVIAVVFVAAELIAGIVLCHTYPPLSNLLQHAASRPILHGRRNNGINKGKTGAAGAKDGQVEVTRSQVQLARAMITVLAVLILFEAGGNAYAAGGATEDPFVALLAGLIGLGWPLANVTAVSVAAEGLLITLVLWLVHVLVGTTAMTAYGLLRWCVPIVIPSRAAELAHRAFHWLNGIPRGNGQAPTSR
ncbi:MAG: hypothetical protein N2512_08930 [Armatimonadetes bacterium]|nr:hypothetical protein [Armatimonadota bacterium]